MTLLLGEVVTLLAAAAIWLAAAVALAILAAIAVSALARRGPRPLELRLAAIAGLVAAGLAGRLAAPDPLEFSLLRRPLPVSWLLGGAIAGAALARLRRRVSPSPGETLPSGTASPPPSG